MPLESILRCWRSDTRLAVYRRSRGFLGAVLGVLRYLGDAFIGRALICVHAFMHLRSCVHASAFMRSCICVHAFMHLRSYVHAPAFNLSTLPTHPTPTSQHRWPDLHGAGHRLLAQARTLACADHAPCMLATLARWQHKANTPCGVCACVQRWLYQML